MFGSQSKVPVDAGLKRLIMRKIKTRRKFQSLYKIIGINESCGTFIFFNSIFNCLHFFIGYSFILFYNASEQVE